MRISSSVLLALEASAFVSAAPSPGFSPAHALDTRAARCVHFNRLLVKIGTSQSRHSYISLAPTVTTEICADAGWNFDCSKAAPKVQSGMALLFVAPGNESGAKPVNHRRDVGDNSTELVAGQFAASWEAAIASTGGHLSVDSVSTLPFDVEHERLSRRDGDPELIDRVILRGVETPHNPGEKQDLIALHFADGNAQLQIPVSNNGTFPEDDSLLKRDGKAPGFKISYTTRTPSKLSKNNQNIAVRTMSASWAGTATSYQMTDYIGFQMTDNFANFYYRIIPESRNFGLNYESVDICGQLGDDLTRTPIN